MNDEARKIINALNQCSISDSDTIINAVEFIKDLSTELERENNRIDVLTARKIADALRLCNKDGNCSNCAFREEKFYCVERLHYAAANMLERLSAELEVGHCIKCKHVEKLADEYPCNECVFAAGNKGNELMWEWRGICAENSGGVRDD